MSRAFCRAAALGVRTSPLAPLRAWVAAAAGLPTGALPRGSRRAANAARAVLDADEDAESGRGRSRAAEPEARGPGRPRHRPLSVEEFLAKHRPKRGRVAPDSRARIEAHEDGLADRGGEGAEEKARVSSPDRRAMSANQQKLQRYQRSEEFALHRGSTVPDAGAAEWAGRLVDEEAEEHSDSDHSSPSLRLVADEDPGSDAQRTDGPKKDAALRWKAQFRQRLIESMKHQYPSALPVNTDYLQMRKLISDKPPARRKQKSGGAKLADPAEAIRVFEASLAESLRSRGDPEPVRLAWNTFRELHLSGEVHLAVGQPPDRRRDPDPFKIPTADLLRLMDVLRQDRMEAECEQVLAVVRGRWTAQHPGDPAASAFRTAALARAFELALDCHVRRAWSAPGPDPRRTAGAKPHPNLAGAHAKVLRTLRQLNSTRGLVPSADVYNAVLRLHFLADPAAAEGVATRMLTEAVHARTDDERGVAGRTRGIRWNWGTYALFLLGYSRMADAAGVARWTEALARALDRGELDVLPGGPHSLDGEAIGALVRLCMSTGHEDLARKVWEAASPTGVATEPMLAGMVAGLSALQRWDDAAEVVARRESDLLSHRAGPPDPFADARRTPGLQSYTYLLDAHFRSGRPDLAERLAARMCDPHGLDLRPDARALAAAARGFRASGLPDAPERALGMLAAFRAAHQVAVPPRTMHPLLERALEEDGWGRTAKLLAGAAEQLSLPPDTRILARMAAKAAAEGDVRAAEDWLDGAVGRGWVSVDDAAGLREILAGRGTAVEIADGAEQEAEAGSEVDRV
ncbi:hypothetical protein DFJ74DRAFT_702793 [Hyaloraphidium curvatum]|nr:hypothetical protein DFJ74DRAFT_702793 [Hyaloraphidium curvatum]